MGGLEIWGQKGGHFLFGARNRFEFAAKEFAVASNAIIEALNINLGLKSASGARRKR